MLDHYFPELFALYRQELTGEFAKARALRAARHGRKSLRPSRWLPGRRGTTAGRL